MHVLTLFDRYLFVHFEDGRVVETQSDVSEGEDGLHGHEKRYSGFDWKRVRRQRVLEQELVELANLFAAKREHMNERQEAFDIKWIALAEPQISVDLFLLVLFDSYSFIYL